jgi:hypothetical protein
MCFIGPPGWTPDPGDGDGVATGRAYPSSTMPPPISPGDPGDWPEAAEVGLDARAGRAAAPPGHAAAAPAVIPTARAGIVTARVNLDGLPEVNLDGLPE